MSGLVQACWLCLAALGNWSSRPVTCPCPTQGNRCMGAGDGGEKRPKRASSCSEGWWWSGRSYKGQHWSYQLPRAGCLALRRVWWALACHLPLVVRKPSSRKKKRHERKKKIPSVLVLGDSIFNKRTFTTCREKEKKKSGIFLVNLYLGDKI